MVRYDFLVETYQTERLKTLGVWGQIPDGRMRFRPEPRARSPLEHMVHQCTSEEKPPIYYNCFSFVGLEQGDDEDGQKQ